MGQALFDRGYPCKQDFLRPDLLHKGPGSCDGAYRMHPLRTLRQCMSKPHRPCDDDAGSPQELTVRHLRSSTVWNVWSAEAAPISVRPRRPLTQAFKEMRKTVAANRRKKG